MRLRILITGAAGNAAQMVCEQLADRYDLLLTDIRQPETCLTSNFRWLISLISRTFARSSVRLIQSCIWQ